MNKPRNKQEQRHRQAGIVKKMLHNQMSKARDEEAYKDFKRRPYMTRKRNNDIIVNSMQEVDMSTLLVPAIAVYERPEDYPEAFAARVFDVDTPTNVVMLKDTLEEIQEDIKKHTEKQFFARGKEDVKALIGVWM